MSNFKKKIEQRMKLYREGMETRNPVSGKPSNPISPTQPIQSTPPPTTTPTQQLPVNKNQSQPQQQTVKKQLSPQQIQDFVNYLGDNVDNPDTMNNFLQLVKQNPNLANIFPK